jgi:transcriptional regulator with XRE-family HTH domain
MHYALKNFRERLFLRLSDLAQVLGVSRSMLHLIETGKRSMKADASFRLACLLNHEQEGGELLPVTLLSDDEISTKLAFESDYLAKLKRDLLALEKVLGPSVKRQSGMVKLLTAVTQNPELFPLSPRWKEMAELDVQTEKATRLRQDYWTVRKKIAQSEALLQFLKNPDNQYFSIG